MNKLLALAIVLVVIGFGSLLFSLTYTAFNLVSAPSQGWGMMGNGMMGNGMMNFPVADIDNATFNSINHAPVGVTVNTERNSISIDASGLTIPVEAAPLWYPQSGEYWLAYGLVNPTFRVKQGVVVNFLFINMDNETHMAGVTSLPPPYPEMPMMNSMMGNGMMQGGYGSVSWLSVGAMVLGVQGQTSRVYSDSMLPTTFNQPGTFWYICLYPRHAQMGMYGEIDVVN
jgi:rusticyanin